MAYVVATFGVMPAPRTIMGWLAEVAGERYPCDSHGCGCVSARECWTSCCCHSEHERLVWAIENGVMPPPMVKFSDEQWIAAANDVRAGNAHCVMCVERIKGELRRGIATRPEHDAACECGGAAMGAAVSRRGRAARARPPRSPRARRPAMTHAALRTTARTGRPGPDRRSRRSRVRGSSNCSP